jgi:hypothetical protein
LRPTTTRATPSRDGVIDHARQAGGYLTDGVELYRSLGAIPSAVGEMIGLENCHTLDVTLCRIAELRARQLRIVTPAART